MLEILFISEGKNCKTFLASRLPQNSLTVFVQTRYFFQRLVLLALLKSFPICNISPIIDQSNFFLFLREALIFWWMFEDYIIFLIWPAWVLCNFYLKQKQRFLVESFLENASFNSFHEGIWSITKALKNAGLN